MVSQFLRRETQECVAIMVRSLRGAGEESQVDVQTLHSDRKCGLHLSCGILKQLFSISRVLYGASEFVHSAGVF